MSDPYCLQQVSVESKKIEGKTWKSLSRNGILFHSKQEKTKRKKMCSRKNNSPSLNYILRTHEHNLEGILDNFQIQPLHLIEGVSEKDCRATEQFEQGCGAPLLSYLTPLVSNLFYKSREIIVGFSNPPTMTQPPP